MQGIIKIMTKSNEIETKKQWIESIKKQLSLGGGTCWQTSSQTNKNGDNKDEGSVCNRLQWHIQGLKIFWKVLL